MSEYKLVIVVREDLGISVGQIAAQAVHAAVEILLAPFMTDMGCADRTVFQWHDNPVVVVLGCKTEKELYDIAKKAKENDFPQYIWRDTIHGKHMATCLAIGPDRSDEIDQIIKEMELFA